MYNQIDGRIVGGERLDYPRQYKWLVTLKSADRDHFCGGTLISPTHVLTAAHCTIGGVSLVQVGVHRQSQSGSDACVQTRTVASIINHEQYNDDTLEHDISIVVLSSAVDYDEIDGIDFDGTLGNNVGLSLTVAGWGTISSGGQSSDQPLRAFVPVVAQDQCNVAYGGEVLDGMLCAGFPAGGVDSCQGDSGGPLFAVGSDGKHILTGIVSWGRGCALPGFPGVYTRLSSYTDWLCDKANLFCSSTSPPSPPPSGCVDNPNYIQRGERCSAWAGYSCDDADSRYGYTRAQELLLKTSCPVSCGLCTSSPPPSPSTSPPPSPTTSPPPSPEGLPPCVDPSSTSGKQGVATIDGSSTGHPMTDPPVPHGIDAKELELGPNHVIADGSVTMSVGMLCLILAMAAIGAAALAGGAVLLYLKPSCRPSCRKGKPAPSRAGPAFREPPTVTPKGVSAYGVKVEVAHAAPPIPAAAAASDV